MNLIPTNQRTVTFAERPSLIHSSSEVPHLVAQSIIAVTQSFPTQPSSLFQQKLPRIKAQERVEGFQFKLATQQQIERTIER
ncbi:hypothetical protein JK188_08785 [Providencia sp. JGM181]|uniref:hypothetical protein n=1 Tax=unclassified Providencia TaxID=2633465 RepID=UPI001BA97CAB|nr:MULTISPECIES: hypothetical protein [unclassified Providencia]MBS0924574.1 hypothetical protein [Providencia sp. JGM181]MBS0932516.1 hypothetical protein [Providencia sp. JGM172]MBS0996709.1 hypothetical protein [Providencia sp. JGM178]